MEVQIVDRCTQRPADEGCRQDDVARELSGREVAEGQHHETFEGEEDPLGEDPMGVKELLKASKLVLKYCSPSCHN